MALVCTTGKTFHLVLSKRTTEYLTAYKYIATKLQRAFLPGILGCMEHNMVMAEVAKNAKMRKRTVHITLFDVEDAFGVVTRNLIFETVKRNYIPVAIQTYFKKHYDNAKTKVVTKNFQTKIFSFKSRLFQGDPMSPIICILTFNPISQPVLDQKTLGCNLGQEQIITLPHADDFCVSKTNKFQHRNPINRININTQSMGMKLKQSKCAHF